VVEDIVELPKPKPIPSWKKVEPEIDEEELAWLGEQRKIVKLKTKLLCPRMKPDPLRHTSELLLMR